MSISTWSEIWLSVSAFWHNWFLFNNLSKLYISNMINFLIIMNFCHDLSHNYAIILTVIIIFIFFTIDIFLSWFRVSRSWLKYDQLSHNYDLCYNYIFFYNNFSCEICHFFVNEFDLKIMILFHQWRINHLFYFIIIHFVIWTLMI